MRWLAVGSLVAAAGVSLPLAWEHNARERTSAGITAWEQRNFDGAQRALEQALDLGGETPRALYNAGTGRLGGGTPGAAIGPLGKAAEARGPERADALYNLGNAFLASGDPTSAIEAYKASLRERPSFVPAKHNLELALQKEQQSDSQQGQQQQQQGGGQGEGEGGGGGGGGQPPPQAPPEQGQDGGAGGQQPQPQGGGGQQRSDRLPDFTPQKDMSPQQAAALLEAVENLEREQRRAQADELRRQRAKETSEKDW